jgi:opacity protein-like surface antigen
MMKRAMLCSMLLTAFATTAASAQFGVVHGAPKTWISISLNGVQSPKKINDTATNRLWDIGGGLGVGLGVHRQLGNTFHLGLEMSFIPSINFNSQDLTTGAPVFVRQHARLWNGLASVRIRRTLAGTVAAYGTGGAGLFVWNVPDENRHVASGSTQLHGVVNTAAYAGAGIEYTIVPGNTLFAEVGRQFVFHKDETKGVNGFKAGLRLSLQ